MVPSPSTRRRFIAAGGAGLVTAFTGCTVQRLPPENGPAAGPTSTTYSFELRNEIASKELEAYPPIDGTPPAALTVTVEANLPDGSEETIVNESFEVPPGETRTLADAFTTKTDGTSYIVSVSLGKFQRYEEFGHAAENHSAGHRFTPGGYGQPTGSTFVATVTETEPKGQYFQAKVTLTVPGQSRSTPA